MKESAFLTGQDAFIERLRQIEAFSSLPDDLLRELLMLTRVRQYEAGEVLIHEGRYDCWVFILVSGTLEVEKNNMLVTTLRRGGDIVGEMGFIDGSPRSATIRAGTRAMCMAMDVCLLERLTHEHRVQFEAVLYRLFAEVLTSRLREVTDEVSVLRAENERLRALCGARPEGGEEQ